MSILPKRTPASHPAGSRRSVMTGSASLLIGGILLAACTAAATPGPSGGATASPGGGSVAHATGAHALVIRYEQTGGFVAPQFLVTRYPIVSVYGDGTSITEGGVPAIYPGQALPNLQVTKITEAGIQKLLARARGAGLLGADASYDVTNVADATTAEFTVVAGGVTHHVTAYALGMTQDAGLDPAVAAARARLQVFADALGDLHKTVGADAAADVPYDYDGIRIYVTPGAPVLSDPSITRDPIDWPLSTGLATFGGPGTGSMSNARCGVVTGADLDLLKPLLSTATQITPWRSGGKLYTLLLLPLLPDQAACPKA